MCIDGRRPLLRDTAISPLPSPHLPPFWSRIGYLEKTVFCSIAARGCVWYVAQLGFGRLTILVGAVSLFSSLLLNLSQVFSAYGIWVMGEQKKIKNLRRVKTFQ